MSGVFKQNLGGNCFLIEKISGFCTIFSLIFQFILLLLAEFIDSCRAMWFEFFLKYLIYFLQVLDLCFLIFTFS